MRNFAFDRATSPEDAVRRLGTGTMALAGSTELLNWMRLGIAEPDALLDISKLEGLRGIRREGDAFVLGALTTLADMEAHEGLRRDATVLSVACGKAASAQIRNRATIAGNLLQKTRCGYFRSEVPLPWGCNKRAPGSGCAAREGVNDQHAIFGWSDACVATQPSDPVVALAALDARLDVAGPRGTRSIPVREFHLTPAEADPTQETRLAPDELILRVVVPVRLGARSAYLKVRERESYAYATVSAAAVVERQGDRIGRATVVLGSVAAKPWRLEAAEADLQGRPFEKAALREPIAAAMRDARPLEHNAYKITIATNAAVRALMMAGDRA